jgi:pilus assembly protein CpaB
MENMRVLAFGAITSRSTDGRIENIPVATLEVTPEEGERLAMATRQGQIHLLLRGNGDPNKKTPPLR